MTLTPSKFQHFSQLLLEWHALHGRAFLWTTKHPYDVWLSEVMLQQTQVATVVERFAAFKDVFPTINALARASVEDVLAQWSGLGYYRRARNLHSCAQQLVVWIEEHGDWPKDSDIWISFPGVGRSTANAIVSACFDKIEPILDANAKRVLLRFAGDLEASEKEAWAYAALAMDVKPEQAAAYTQAIMDLGATVCTARKAMCTQCPLNANCRSVGWVRTSNALKKAANPEIIYDWVRCQKGDRVLMQQRDESSFWPALWVFPDTSDRFLLDSGVNADVKTHKLSHRTLHLTLRSASEVTHLHANERWVLINDVIERRLPAPAPVASWLD